MVCGQRVLKCLNSWGKDKWMPNFFRKITKPLVSLLERLGDVKNAKKLKNAEKLKDSVDFSHGKLALAEKNLDDMRKKYKVLAEQYLEDQERWRAIETRLKSLTEKVSSPQSKQGTKMKRKRPSQNGLKSKTK